MSLRDTTKGFTNSSLALIQALWFLWIASIKRLRGGWRGWALPRRAGGKMLWKGQILSGRWYLMIFSSLKSKKWRLLRRLGGEAGGRKIRFDYSFLGYLCIMGILVIFQCQSGMRYLWLGAIYVRVVFMYRAGDWINFFKSWCSMWSLQWFGRVWLGFLLSLLGYVCSRGIYVSGGWLDHFLQVLVLCVVFGVVRVCLAWISSKSLGLVGVFNL